MGTLQNKIMAMNCKKNLRNLLIAAVCFTILSIVLFSVMYAPQIKEMQNLENTFRSNISFAVYDYGYDSLPFIYNGFQLTEPSSLVKAISAVICISAATISLLIYLNIIFWVFQASAKAKMNTALWVVLAICGNVFAMILFIMIRSMTRRKCPECQSYTRTKNQYCPECGHQFIIKCEKSGAYSEKGDKFCHNCGEEIS